RRRADDGAGREGRSSGFPCRRGAVRHGTGGRGPWHVNVYMACRRVSYSLSPASSDPRGRRRWFSATRVAIAAFRLACSTALARLALEHHHGQQQHAGRDDSTEIIDAMRRRREYASQQDHDGQEASSNQPALPARGRPTPTESLASEPVVLRVHGEASFTAASRSKPKIHRVASAGASRLPASRRHMQAHCLLPARGDAHPGDGTEAIVPARPALRVGLLEYSDTGACRHGPAVDAHAACGIAMDLQQVEAQRRLERAAAGARLEGHRLALPLHGEGLAESVAVFIGIGGAVVVEDLDGKFGDRLFAHVIHHRLRRDDRAIADEQRDVAPALVVDRETDGLTALVGLAAEPVGPDAGRQIDVLFGLTLLHHRRYQQVIAERPAVDVVAHVLVVRPAEYQWTNQADTADVAPVFVAVDVGDQAVAQTDRVGGGLLRNRAVDPRLALFAERAMHAEDRRERAELDPAGVVFIGGMAVETAAVHAPLHLAHVEVAVDRPHAQVGLCALRVVQRALHVHELGVAAGGVGFVVPPADDALV